MKKRIAIGVSDFREMLTGAYSYENKNLFIKDLLEDGSKVILLPRPRRFGKKTILLIDEYDVPIQQALAQIEAKEYQQELLERGIHKIIKLAIVFREKEVLVKA